MTAFDEAWSVLKMTQIEMTPDEYMAQRERHRVDALDSILARDPAQNIGGAMYADRGYDLSGHTNIGEYNQYLPITTDRPLQGDTLQEARDDGFTIVTEGAEPGGKRTYNFRTKSTGVPYKERPKHDGSIEWGTITDYDQRSRQPLPPEGQEAAKIALGLKEPGEFRNTGYYGYGSYVPEPPHMPATRERLGRILQDPSPEDIERIMNRFGEENKTARAIGAMRGHKGGKYGSGFAREQSEKLIEDWLEENVHKPERERQREARRASAELRREKDTMRDAMEDDIYDEADYMKIPRYRGRLGGWDKPSLNPRYFSSGPHMESYLDDIPEFRDFKEAQLEEEKRREESNRRFAEEQREREEKRREEREYLKENPMQGPSRPQGGLKRYAAKPKPKPMTSGELRRKKYAAAVAAADAKREQEKVAVRKPKRRKFGTVRGGRKQ